MGAHLARGALRDALARAATGAVPNRAARAASDAASAARIAAWSRIPTVVAGADSSLAEIVAGEDVGTWVEPRSHALAARKLWIAFCQPVSGSIRVDDGALRNGTLDGIERALAAARSGPTAIAFEVVTAAGECGIFEAGAPWRRRIDESVAAGLRAIAGEDNLWFRYNSDELRGWREDASDAAA